MRTTRSLSLKLRFHDLHRPLPSTLVNGVIVANALAVVAVLAATVAIADRPGVTIGQLAVVAVGTAADVGGIGGDGGSNKEGSTPPMTTTTRGALVVGGGGDDGQWRR
jgi:hypothetical protein